MTSRNNCYTKYPNNYLNSLQFLINFQQDTGLQIIRKEGEVLIMIKQEPGQPVKYYMNKSGISPRWFHEILKQLLGSKLVEYEHCPNDSRRKLLR